MRVLLTGGDGFIGSRLRELYDDVDWVVYDLKRGLNVLDVETLREHAAGCETVVHLAAMIDQVESCENPAYYYLHNIEGTRRVAQVAKAVGARVVFASSSAVYDWNANPYALSKWVGEQIVGVLPKHYILRLFNVYGPGDRPNTVIPTFIKCVKTGTPVTIFGDGKQVRDFIHVDDVCDEIARVLTHRYWLRPSIDNVPVSRMIKTVGTGIETTINVLAAEVMAVLDRQVGIKHAPARQEIRHAVVKRGIALTISLEDGIRELAELL